MHRNVGLDWAQDSLRIATLQSGFRGFAVQEVRAALLPAEGTPAERLAAGLASAGLVPPLGPDDSVAVSLPGGVAATHTVSLPFTDPKRIEQVLPAEVEGAIPFDLDEVVWDHAVLGQSGGKTDVLVGIVRKAVLREFLEALAAAGVEPRVVTLAPLALSALGERGVLVPEGAPPLTAALLDGGPDRADLALVDAGRPVLARSLATSNAQAWAAAATDETARNRLLSQMLRDLKISLRTKRLAPQRLLLAGPLVTLPGAAERLTAETQLPAEPVALPAGGDPTSALALGLALRAQTPRGRINFRKGEFAFTRDLSSVRGQIARLGVAAAVLLVLGFVLGMARLSSLHRQAAAYDEAVCAATKRILGTCTTDYRQAIGQLSGGRSRAAGIPRVSAADVLAELVARLPEGSLPLLDDVEVTTTAVRVRGTAESFGKVEEINAALRKNKCFGEIKPPRTEKSRDGNKITFSYDFPYTCSGEPQGGA
ncbi:MAG TPA: pilus assembly protein PilM [Myxococcales bacterium]|nr:pilus assembly protein PilM [Myxococcales bacterium]